MLDNLRNFATTWPGKILGALLLLGLAGFGISGVITGISGNTVARIGDREITSLDFQRAYQAQVNVAAQQTGVVPTPEQAVALGIPSTVLTRLATDEAINMLGEQFGLGVSDERLAETLRDDPAFGGTLGAFDRDNFQQTLRRNGYTENEFFESRREVAHRQQLALGIFGHIRTPDTMKRLVRRFGEDRRTLDYFILSEINLLPIDPATDEQLTAFLADVQAQYRTQETRSIETMVLTPQVLAERHVVSEAELLAEYDRMQPSLIRIERRTLSQVVLPADVTVRWFELGQATGKDFASLIQETGLVPSELGSLTQAEITDSAMAEAAFEAVEGQFVIVDGVIGKRAVFVSEIEPGGQMTLEEVRERLTDKLKLERGRVDFIEVLDQIEESRAAFVALSDIAAQFALELHSVDITATGTELGDIASFETENFARVANSVFAAQIDRLSPSIALGANKNVWFDLLAIEPDRDQTLDEVKDTLAENWMADQRAVALADQADAMIAQLASGQPFSDVAIANGLFPQISQPVHRGGDGSGIIDFSVAVRAHEGGVGHFGAERNANGDYIVFQVTSLTPADEELSDGDNEFIVNSFRDNIYSEFAAGLRQDANLRVNQQTLSLVLGLDGTNR